MCTFHILQNPINKMWTVGAVLLSLLSTTLCTSFVCPDEAICKEPGQIESKSLEFFKKLSQKQYSAITHLTVTNASLEKLEPRIKYLKNLEYLDLSDNNLEVSSLPSLPNLKVLKLAANNLKQIRFSNLPHNIVELDLSNNYLTHIPKDWEILKSLKTLIIFKNPIDCECQNVVTIMKIRTRNVNISERLICHSPKQYHGKDINSINCSVDDLMMQDAPEVEGSGDTDIFENELLTSSIPHLAEEDDGKIDENTIIDDKVENDHLTSPEVVDNKDTLPSENDEQLLDAKEITTKETILGEEEGSGDEGSGFIDVEIPDIPACHINCSTPQPVGSHDEQGASELPNTRKQLQTILEDILNPLQEDKQETSTSSTTTSSTTPKESIPIKVSEEPVQKEVNHNVLRVPDKESNAETISPETNTAQKMAKATALNNDNSYAVYVVVAVGLLLAVVFLVCLVKNRKNKRNKKRREIPQGYGEEMKPLGKPPVFQSVNEKNGKTGHIAENSPLINGNGKAKDEPVLTAFTPLAHPEILPSEDGEEPELRLKPELLTPTTERVTIRASEIPDSIPKTPLLVDRKKNSDGDIVSTVLPP